MLGEKISPSATLCTVNPTWAVLDSNPALRHDRPCDQPPEPWLGLLLTITLEHTHFSTNNIPDNYENAVGFNALGAV
jgi:hypothetical protein